MSHHPTHSTLRAAVIGNSPTMTWIGYLFGTLVIIVNAIDQGGIPDNAAGWINTITGIGIAALGRFAQQTTVTFAKQPQEPSYVDETTGKP